MNPLPPDLLNEFAGLGRQMKREDDAKARAVSDRCMRTAKARVGALMAIAAGFTDAQTGEMRFSSEVGQFVTAFLGDRRQKGFPLNRGWFAGKQARIDGLYSAEIALAYAEDMAKAPAPAVSFII